MINATGLIYNTYFDYLCSPSWIEKKENLISKKRCCQICGASNKEVTDIRYYEEQGLFNPIFFKKHISFENILTNERVKIDKNYIRTIQISILTVHHKSYDRLGSEKESDLIVVCNECHTRIHNKGGNNNV